MRIGITGAGGFVGSFIAEDLLTRGAGPLRALTSRPAMNFAHAGEIDVRIGDLESMSDCQHFVEGLDVIYHLAHRGSPISSGRDLVADTQRNLIPTLNLIEAASQSSHRVHFVFFSSGGAMYTPSAEGVPFREDDPPRPTSSYGVQKLAAENYFRLAAERGKITACVLRVGNAFGTLLPLDRQQGLIGVALASALAGRAFRVFGNPGNVRDYVHLRDIADIAWRVRAPGHPFLVVNAGSGTGHSVQQVLDIITQIHGPFEIEYVPSAGADLTNWAVLDITKARTELGWSPKIGLEEGILATLGRFAAAKR